MSNSHHAAAHHRHAPPPRPPPPLSSTHPPPPPSHPPVSHPPRASSSSGRAPGSSSTVRKSAPGSYAPNKPAKRPRKGSSSASSKSAYGRGSAYGSGSASAASANARYHSSSSMHSSHQRHSSSSSSKMGVSAQQLAMQRQKAAKQRKKKMMSHGRLPAGVSAGDDPKLKKKGGSSCHQCKSRRNFTALTYCTGSLDKKNKSCRKKFCEHCLKKFYKESPVQIKDKAIWKCPSCRGICCCAACRRRRLRDAGHLTASASASASPSGGSGSGSSSATGSSTKKKKKKSSHGPGRPSGSGSSHKRSGSSKHAHRSRPPVDRPPTLPLAKSSVVPPAPQQPQSMVPPVYPHHAPHPVYGGSQAYPPAPYASSAGSTTSTSTVASSPGAREAAEAAANSRPPLLPASIRNAPKPSDAPILEGPLLNAALGSSTPTLTASPGLVGVVGTFTELGPAASGALSMRGSPQLMPFLHPVGNNFHILPSSPSVHPHSPAHHSLPHLGSGSDDAMPSPESVAVHDQQFATLYAVSQTPKIQKHIKYILERNDITDPQKVETIATLLRDSVPEYQPLS